MYLRSFLYHLIRVEAKRYIRKVLQASNFISLYLIGLACIFLISIAIINQIQLKNFKDQFELLNNQWIPLCTEGVMNKGIVKVFPPNRIDQDMIPLIHKDNKCRLHFYDKADIVTCIEALTRMTHADHRGYGGEDNTYGSISASFMTPRNQYDTIRSIKLHVAFVGDSRIHQIFMNLVIPMLAFIEDGCPKAKDDVRYRYDKCVAIPIMDAYFSYRSLPKYDNDYMEAVEEWVLGKSMAPHYLVIGSTAHHAASFHKAAGIEPEFNGNITRLASLLNQMSKRYNTRIVWWKDELVPKRENHNNFDMSLIETNRIVHKIFKKQRVPIEIWDSTNDLFMTYLRLCDGPWDIGREGRWVLPPLIAHPNSWIKCKEIIHAPQAYATIQGQLVANDLCNRVMPNVTISKFDL